MAETLFIRCTSCGANNRVAQTKLDEGHTPKCGQCKRPLPLSSTGPVVVTDSSFGMDVERSPLPVLLDAWAAWCGPCRMIAPAIEELATELAGKVRVAKLNVDENPQTASRFDIRSIPTLLVLTGGREIHRIVGAKPKAAIRAELEQALTNAR